jgi:aminocarboxymuconate-semialdehyde decarboxylase
MRYIDAFNHFFPPAFFKKMSETAGGTRDIGKRMQGIPAIYDLDTRFRLVDGFLDYTQVLSLGMPPLEGMVGPDAAPEFARVANDGLAELVAKYPERFCGWVGALPMNAPDEAVREAERILTRDGANGLQIHTNVNGHCLDEPQFLPIFEVAAKAGKPILLHPARTPGTPDFAAETRSRYEIWSIFGWPYETSVTMARLVFSGITTRFPELKIVTHHLGAMIPFFDARIEIGWSALGSRSSDEDLSHIPKMLDKPIVECFRQFYADTAVAGSHGAVACGLEFFGADHVLFASDAPFDPEGGALYIRESMKAVQALQISEADRAKICHGNAETLFGIV